MKTETKKIEAVKIEILRAEGLTTECGKYTLEGRKNQSGNVWVMADSLIHGMAQSTHEGAGYDKCDFTVTFSDGETYSRRFDMTHEHTVGAGLLAEHINGWLEFCTGDKKPDHMSEKQYTDYLRLSGGEAVQKEARDFLNTYQIGKGE